MKISYNWIQEYFEDQLPSPTELATLLNVRAFEVEEVEERDGDSIFEIKITPDRAHDCLSHLGIAKEIGLHTKIKMKPILNFDEIQNSFETKYTAEVIDSSCVRYMLREVQNVVVTDSPLELKIKLEQIGQRSINTIVDITNLVMYEIGQPMHAFDADKLDGTEIKIGAPVHKNITTLDLKEIELTDEDITIQDQKDNLAIAGVKGGKKAEVNKNTKTIIIESANFFPVKVRRTSKRINIQTDSSKRFENGITPKLAETAIKLTSFYIKKYASDSDTKFSNIIDVYPRPASPYYTGVSLQEIKNKLGIEITKDEVSNIFDRLGFEYEYLNTKEFVLEEIRRHIGTPHNTYPSLTYDAPHSFDCTTLTAYVFAHGGISIPRLTIDQLFFGKEITKEELEPGDLIFSRQDDGKIRYDTVSFLPGRRFEEGVDHVGMYMGDDTVIHSSRFKEKVTEEKLSESSSFKHIVGYRRIVDSNEMRFAVHVPSERIDIKDGINLIEEIGRVYGYEHIVPIESKSVSQASEVSLYDRIVTIKSHLIDLGFDEVVTYTFQQKGDVEVVKPLAKDKAYLRTNLIKGLQESLELNFKSKELFGESIIKIFEVGHTFKDGKEKLCLGLGVKSSIKKQKAKDILKDTFDYLSQKTGIDFDVILDDTSETVEVILDSLIDTTAPIYNSLYALSPKEYAPFSLYPFIVRDVAVWSGANDSRETIEKIISDNGTNLLVRFDLFDTFAKDSKTSYAYRLIFQSDQTTLTDEEVSKIMEAIYSKLQSNPDFEIR